MECKFCSKKFKSEVRFQNHEKTCSVSSSLKPDSLQEIEKLRMDNASLRIKVDDIRAKIMLNNKKMEKYTEAIKQMFNVTFMSSGDQEMILLKEKVLKLEEENLRYKLELNL